MTRSKPRISTTRTLDIARLATVTGGGLASIPLGSAKETTLSVEKIFSVVSG